jgi:putative ABC transport system permease protein
LPWGFFAVGTIVSSQATLSVELDKSYAAINPSTGTVRTAETFDEDFVRAVRGMKHVADADARRAIETRIQNASGKWINLTIFAVEDYDAMRVNKVFHQEGAWPPPDHEILIERAALQVIKAE